MIQMVEPRVVKDEGGVKKNNMIQVTNTEVMDGDKGGYRQINKSLNICAFEDYLKGQTANLPSLLDVEQLTPRVLRILGQNPGKVRIFALPVSECF